MNMDFQVSNAYNGHFLGAFWGNIDICNDQNKLRYITSWHISDEIVNSCAKMVQTKHVRSVHFQDIYTREEAHMEPEEDQLTICVASTSFLC